MLICPKPNLWHEVHKRLVAAAAQIPGASPPPRPLILSGWAYSNDIEKRDRWADTMEWARRSGLEHLIPRPSEGSWYAVGVLFDGAVGPMDGPMHLGWNSNPRPPVSDEMATHAIDRLRSDWVAIVGPGLGEITRPLALTGPKRRRLLAWADASTQPPWGSWTSLAQGDVRRHFTRFRQAINASIQPLEVDHADFVHADLESTPRRGKGPRRGPDDGRGTSGAMC
ncbi:MAG: hypothetical protein KIT43_08205 [Bauldia sp.]|nr:hypothetical protein [Bauldia sp.]MCW5716894.1 hypothetical protein [Bauldia sp.]